mgnify:CR=1 FL=1
MKVSFNKIILHNFISFSHSEVVLNNRDYCLVSGVNNCPLDNTVSNGSGKSSIWSAITYALTGETISGLKDVKNKFVDEKSCYVSLDFTVDGDDYVVTRIKEPKSDLKISVNGEDKSGKGVKESSVILAQYLPDLTFDLISSVILIGQGMPNKLSGKSPSGRKINWTWMIYASFFDLLKKIALCDIKAPVQQMLRKEFLKEVITYMQSKEQLRIPH